MYGIGRLELIRAAELMGVGLAEAKRMLRQWDQDVRVETILDLRRMYPAASVCAIARSVGVTPKTVRLWLGRHGLMGQSRKGVWTPVSEGVAVQIAELSASMSVSQIARRLGLAFSTVRNKVERGRSSIKLSHKLTRQQIDDIKRRSGSEPDRVLAEEYGVSKSTVQYHRQRAGKSKGDA